MFMLKWNNFLKLKKKTIDPLVCISTFGSKLYKLVGTNFLLYSHIFPRLLQIIVYCILCTYYLSCNPILREIFLYYKNREVQIIVYLVFDPLSNQAKDFKAGIFCFSANLAMSNQTKDFKAGIFCFSANLARIMHKYKDWLVLNQDNVSEWNDISTGGLLSVR